MPQIATAEQFKWEQDKINEGETFWAALISSSASPNVDSTLASLVSAEVNYQGSGRQSFTMPASTIISTTVSLTIYKYARSESPTITFNPTSGPITFSYLLVIADGNGTTGNSTGRIKLIHFFDNGSGGAAPQTINQNDPRSFTISFNQGVLENDIVIS